MKVYWIILVFLLPGCTSQETKVPDEKPSEKTNIQLLSLPATSEAYIGVDNLRLRAEPGQQGQEIARLPVSTKVVPTGRESDFSSSITLRGIPYDEPWFEIEAGQLKGWVFGGALDFDPTTSELNKKLFRNRLINLSPKHYKQLEAFIESTRSIETSDDFLAAYQVGLNVEDDFNDDLEKKIEMNGEQPQLMWLDKGFPGWCWTFAAEGTMLQMTKDYKEWAEMAAKTTNAADDSFIAFLNKVNGFEHREQIFPNYFLQTWDYGGSSHLGEGIHVKLLKEAETLYGDQTAFSPLIQQEAQKIVQDILNIENSYWNPLGPIDAELSEILSTTWTVISPEELATLQKRRTAFTDHKKNGITINEKGS